MNSEFNEQLFSKYDSTTLARYILASESCKVSSRVFSLSPNLIAKQFLRGEEIGMLNALELATLLGVRVPKIKRTVEANENVYVIMERIGGPTLEEAWTYLSWFTTLRLAFQLRRFVHRMRAQTSTTAGDLSDGKCKSVWLDDYYGLPPHPSPETIAAFIHFWINFVPPSRRQTEKQHNKEFLSQHHGPLVFTHQDLAPRNMIVDERRHLWLLDWDHSGWYPAYFEYASMQNFDIPSTWGGQTGCAGNCSAGFRLDYSRKSTKRSNKPECDSLDTLLAGKMKSYKKELRPMQCMCESQECDSCFTMGSAKRTG